MRLIPATCDDFPLLYAALTDAFPENERRDESDARSLFGRADYRPYHIEDGGRRVGFFSLFDLGEFLFVEHFLILPEYRCRGLGAKALALLAGRTLVLEAELPTTPMAARRLGFYRRCGFVINPIDYAQPPYRATDTPTPMLLLSFPSPLPSPKDSADMLYRLVYHTI